MYFGRMKPRKGKILVPLAAFLLLMCLFLAGIGSVSRGTVRRQKETLEKALNRCVTWCYAVEGSYPQSLEDMEERYGLRYDKEHFFVDYRSRGANVLPEITVLEKGG